MEPLAVSLPSLLAIVGGVAATLKFLDWYIAKSTEALRNSVADVREDINEVKDQLMRLDAKLDDIIIHHYTQKD
jgi:hypothetical protein